MNLNEVWYALAGLAVAILGHRLGIPVLGPTPAKPASLEEIVRKTILEVLRALAEPKPDPAVREKLQEALTK